VGYAFDLIFQSVFADRWTDLSFQLVYTPLMTMLCLAIAIFFHHHDLNSPHVFVQKAAKFLKIIPGFVAAWAWSALGSAVAKHIWEAPDDDIDLTLRGSILAGAWGLIAIVLVGVSIALQKCCTSESDIVTEVFTNIGGCNIGWSWKTAGTYLFDAMGGDLIDQWVLTVVASIVVPCFAALLLVVVHCTKKDSYKAGELQMLPREETGGSEYDEGSALCGFCQQDEDDDDEDDEAPVVQAYQPTRVLTYQPVPVRVQ